MALKQVTHEILFDPAFAGANHLCILSAYATPNMASWLIKNLQDTSVTGITISLLVGMAPIDGISVPVHEGFKEIHGNSFPKAISQFSCSYLYELPPIHANYYIWMKNDKPVTAFCGSADFVQRAFLTEREEIMLSCSPVSAYQRFLDAEARSIYCNHAEIEEYVVLHPTHVLLDNDNALQGVSGDGVESVTLSLLTNKCCVGNKSGLNWGQRNKRNRNEAYIPLPIKIARSGFFPPAKQHFTVVTDDGHNLILRIEQQNDKAITTPLSNAQLGEYFRNRLGLANGAFVTLDDLERYGRTDVTFYKIDDEQYYMDFRA